MTLSGMGHICRAGETFDSVALAVYGDEKYACELLNANPALCTKQVFAGGELLILPVATVPEKGSSNDYMPAVAPWKEG